MKTQISWWNISEASLIHSEHSNTLTWLRPPHQNKLRVFKLRQSTTALKISVKWPSWKSTLDGSVGTSYGLSASSWTLLLQEETCRETSDGLRSINSSFTDECVPTGAKEFMDEQKKACLSCCTSDLHTVSLCPEQGFLVSLHIGHYIICGCFNIN